MNVMENNLPAPLLRKKVLEMAQTMSEFEVADLCRIPVGDVLAILSTAGKRRVWAARCNRTGRVVTSISERGAYLKVQIVGFADWSFVEGGVQ